jgi:putative flippase GtrA
LSTSTFWFLLVGVAAAATHMLVFTLVLPHLWPELANAFAFCIAFFVSFAGHRLLSFKDAKTSVGTSLRRFAITAVAGFACNEITFSLLLRALQWPALAALLAALVLAAGQTYLLSRFWAFSR